MRTKAGWICFWFIGLLFGNDSFCQPTETDTLLMQRLSRRILYLQSRGDAYFPMGLFPSYREYQFNKGTLKNDDNIFFTGLIIFTLRSIRPYLDITSAAICDSIFQQVQPLYKRFQNKRGRPTYNFWQTDPPKIFPNAGWLNLFDKRQALPDDMDDTAIVLMAKDAEDSIVFLAHNTMQQFTNNSKKKVKSSLPAYKNIAAYSTWFGKKMPVDFDLCVLTNILYLVHSYNLEYSSADSASLRFICRAVQNRDYLKSAHLISPHYNRPPVLLYHLSRLMAQQPIPGLEVFKAQLIADAVSCYQHSANFVDKILLSTALLRWGSILPNEIVEIKTSIETYAEESSFVFFIANMASILPYPLNKWVSKAGIGKFYYYCPAYNDVLLLENTIWRKRAEFF